MVALASLLLIVSSLVEWHEEALLKGKDAALWTQGDCQQLIIKYPGDSESREKAVLLHSTTLLAARIHRSAIQKLGPHNRDLYWVVTCGGANTATFVHSFFKKLSGFHPELSTSEKVQIAMIGKLFPDLSKVNFVWNEGAAFERTSFSPYIVAPIGLTQRGLWSGRVQFQALHREKSEAMDWGNLNGLVLSALDSLAEASESPRWSFRRLHYEHQELVSRFRRLEPLSDRLISFLNPRLFFFKRGWEWMLSSKWVSNDFVPFSETGRAEVSLDFYFLGSREAGEVERDLRRHFTDVLGSDVSFEISTVHTSAFLRSVFEGNEAREIERVLEREPQMIPVPVLSPEMSESRFFREAGLLTYEILPLQTNQPFFQTQDLESLSGDENRASEIEAKILKGVLK